MLTKHQLAPAMCYLNFDRGPLEQASWWRKCEHKVQIMFSPGNRKWFLPDSPKPFLLSPSRPQSIIKHTLHMLSYQLPSRRSCRKSQEQDSLSAGLSVLPAFLHSAETQFTGAQRVHATRSPHVLRHLFMKKLA